MSTFKDYKEKLNCAANIAFDLIRIDVDNIIEYAERSQGHEELQEILDTVIADLKELKMELEDK